MKCLIASRRRCSLNTSLWNLKPDFKTACLLVVEQFERQAFRTVSTE